MKSLGLNRYALAMGAAAALLAGCGGSQPSIGAPGAMQQSEVRAGHTSSTNYKVLYNFGSGSNDGSMPEAGLINVGGTFYGTTSAGGSYSCDYYERPGCGTVFSIEPGGVEKVLHRFANAPDGATPYAPLIALNGKLYGTTYFGGSHSCYGSSYANCGTVFTITRSGAEEVLHSFAGARNDGAYPPGELINVDVTLYGTTNEGGEFFTYNGYGARGTVFSITTSGTEEVVHSFGLSHDGAYPKAGLIEIGGKLYGTTASGGGHGLGTVFSITRGGTEKVLHRFGKEPDGAHPVATLIELKGTLYGTTTGGGAYGEGTVFSITPRGDEKVLHSFGNGADGAHPLASLTKDKDKLYGTTRAGGSHYCSTFSTGCGTVFSITPGGRERVIYDFQGLPDGDWPAGKLLKVGGTFYGTTVFGGMYNDGTVFSLKP